LISLFFSLSKFSPIPYLTCNLDNTDSNFFDLFPTVGAPVPPPPAAAVAALEFAMEDPLAISADNVLIEEVDDLRVNSYQENKKKKPS
jgi:hypothetical protein